MGRQVCVLDGIPLPAFLRDKMGVSFKNTTFWLDTGFDVKSLGRGTTWTAKDVGKTAVTNSLTGGASDQGMV